MRVTIIHGPAKEGHLGKDPRTGPRVPASLSRRGSEGEAAQSPGFPLKEKKKKIDRLSEIEKEAIARITLGARRRGLTMRASSLARKSP
jgi:hypothetical protein